MTASSQNPQVARQREFRRSLVDAAEGAVSEHADAIAADIVAAVWTAVDDELGRLRAERDDDARELAYWMPLARRRDKEASRLRDALRTRPTRAEVLREAADEGERWADGGIESLAVGFFGQHLRRMADAAERGEG